MLRGKYNLPISRINTYFILDVCKISLDCKYNNDNISTSKKRPTPSLTARYPLNWKLLPAPGFVCFRSTSVPGVNPAKANENVMRCRFYWDWVVVWLIDLRILVSVLCSAYPARMQESVHTAPWLGFLLPDRFCSAESECVSVSWFQWLQGVPRSEAEGRTHCRLCGKTERHHSGHPWRVTDNSWTFDKPLLSTVRLVAFHLHRWETEARLYSK